MIKIKKDNIKGFFLLLLGIFTVAFAFHFYSLSEQSYFDNIGLLVILCSSFIVASLGAIIEGCSTVEYNEDKGDK